MRMFEKLTIRDVRCKQDVNKMLKLILFFWKSHLRGHIWHVHCDKDVMIHYNNVNNADCSAGNVQNIALGDCLSS